MEKQHLYQQIASDLRAAIVAGVYHPNDMLPSENELAAKYNTSRVTVRKGLQLLEAENLVRPQHGKGFFVLFPEYARYTMFFQDRKPDDLAKFEDISVVFAGEDIMAKMGVEEDTPLIKIHQSIRRNGTPISYDEKYIRYEKGMPTVEKEISFAEFPDLFTDKYIPVSISTAMQVRAEKAPETVCKTLGIRFGSVLLTIERVITTTDGTVVGYGKRWMTEGAGPITAYSGYIDS